MSAERLAIIVPYRDRVGHLKQFIPHINNRLKNASVFIIEQNGIAPFNRGKLLNAGFLLNPGFDYYCFHDVDMLPLKADYSYCQAPTQLATRASQFGFKMPFKEYFGGCTLFNTADFTRCNGYSNNFLGWGGEDNEMYNNVLKAGLKIEYRDCYFNSLKHTRKVDGVQYQKNLKLMAAGRPLYDGLTHCLYSVSKETAQPGYIKQTVII